MAPLLANLPRLRAGESPLVVPRDLRPESLRVVSADRQGGALPPAPWLSRLDWSCAAVTDLLYRANDRIEAVIAEALRRIQRSSSSVVQPAPA